MIVVVWLIVCPVAIKCQTKIRNLKMTRGTDEEVVWFDISVNPFQLVSFLNTENHLGDVPSRDLLIKDVFA